MNIDDMPAGRKLDALIADKVIGLSTKHRAKRYSTDIDAAWEILWAKSIQSAVPNFLSFGGGKGWLVKFGNYSATTTATDASAGALAICHAALKYVMGEQPR